MSEIFWESLKDLQVSRETVDRLSKVVSLLEKWNPVINLVSKASMSQVWRRHVLDSAQIFTLGSPLANHWIDMGSGGGFPGLIVAVIAAELQPQTAVTLIESDLRKATFLRHTIHQVGLRTQVLAERIENVAPLSADVVSARALAPLTDLLSYAERHLAKSGTAIFPKGAGVQAEIDIAKQNWKFQLEKTPSKTEAGAVVLTIHGVSHV